MGMRLYNSRWFRDAAQTEHRLVINQSTDADLERRQEILEGVQSISFLTTETWWELHRIKDSLVNRRAQSNWKRRCPVCGGWRIHQCSTHPPFFYFLHKDMFPSFFSCKDCEWTTRQLPWWLKPNTAPSPWFGFKLEGRVDTQKG